MKTKTSKACIKKILWIISLTKKKNCPMLNLSCDRDYKKEGLHNYGKTYNFKSIFWQRGDDFCYSKQESIQQWLDSGFL